MHKAVKLYLEDDEDAAIGIGTLIVFIALVLVAAIAAAVIIKTVYSLKDQAEATGEGARQEVAGSIKILSVIGDRDEDDSGVIEATIDELVIYVTVWDGSRGIDISKMRVVVRTDDSVAELTLDTSGTPAPDQNDFWADEVPDNTGGNGWDEGNGQYFLDADNVLKIRIDLDDIGNGGASAGGNGIGPNTAVTLQFMPGSGPVVSEYFVTPPSYSGAEYLDLTAA